jgi:uncharacterized protein YqjF (DUF2071 family)
MINYAVDEKLLIPYLPKYTEIDLWEGTCYVSLVGFMFLNTKVKSIKIPFHTSFEEVNLRFYVRYNCHGERKRGVVFIKEIVPRPTLTFVANSIYKENYETMPMRHRWIEGNGQLSVEYCWKKKNWNSIHVNADNNSTIIEEGSEEEFITEHYWGYTKINGARTSEYEVVHPKWEVYKVNNYLINVDFKSVYGKEFDFLRSEKPKSVFLAEGSDIKVQVGREI